MFSFSILCNFINNVQENVYYRIFKQDDDFNIVTGVRYKKGSVKILEQGDKFVVVVKRYFLRTIPLYEKKFEFNTMEEAEIEYDRQKHAMWRIS